MPIYHPAFDGPPPFVPILGGLMFLLFTILFVGTLLFLAKRGRLAGPPSFFRPPEFEARTILANRYAGGDISTDEFLERAATLNWTPGVDDPRLQDRKKR
ncbi:SHOCT domain-containing protein [Desertihabitans brevis]|uniref:SHOCT domain-containing protein n=1 Tax=Desertihabitans brevis TaxID=2268447 RepID=A0A367YX78_9ACTN|nr:SHOCT domain-containing protein [Desertihabitans brevis]RCK69612.1 SHOCT domain-containing protein [Desertihabitans brevis]